MNQLCKLVGGTVKDVKINSHDSPLPAREVLTPEKRCAEFRLARPHSRPICRVFGAVKLVPVSLDLPLLEAACPALECGDVCHAHLPTVRAQGRLHRFTPCNDFARVRPSFHYLRARTPGRHIASGAFSDVDGLVPNVGAVPKCYDCLLWWFS